MKGTRSIDQMVEAATWLMVQGDRAGAEDLLSQALRIDPDHEGARQAMKALGAPTSPGRAPPRAPIPNQTQPVIPPVRTAADASVTPREPQPALHRGLPQGLGTDEVEAFDAELPFVATPSSLHAREPPEHAPVKPAERTDRHLSLVVPDAPPGGRPASSTQPRLDAEALRAAGTSAPLGKAWSLEVLTGPHAGTSVAVGKRPVLIGKGLGALDVEADPFMSTGHASFFQRHAELWVCDGGSASGTWLTIEGPARLAPGESFSVGLQRLRYLGPLEAAPVEPPWPYGAPRPAVSWRLEHVLMGLRPGRTWILRGVVTLGREGTTVQFPDDDTLAPLHTELRPAGPLLEVVDRSQSPGTFVALPAGGERRLLEGTRVRLGSTLLRVTTR